jgi:hypothetical protein
MVDRGSGGGHACPAGPGRARPPNDIWCILGGESSFKSIFTKKNVNKLKLPRDMTCWPNVGNSAYLLTKLPMLAQQRTKRSEVGYAYLRFKSVNQL